MKPIGIIGGSGLVAPLELISHEQALTTPYGKASGPISIGSMGGCRVVFLPRHGVPRRLAPHQVNYRANIWKLRELGVQAILAVSCVGAINTNFQVGDLVVPDQLIDYTHGREHSFKDQRDAHTGHFDFSEPFDHGLRSLIIQAAEELGHPPHLQDCGCYGVTQGPRFETAAEIRRMARDGCDLVGMTLLPEAALARQLGLSYAALCPVVNMAAGCGDGLVEIEELLRLMASFEPKLQALSRRMVALASAKSPEES